MSNTQPAPGEITGNVDSATVARCAEGNSLVVTVQGWLLHTREEIVDLYFEAPGSSRVKTSRSTRRDIAQNYPDVPYAQNSGYSIAIEVPGDKLCSPLAMQMFATLKSGARISSLIHIPLELPGEARLNAESGDTSDGRLRLVALRNFLSSGAYLSFPEALSPRLSIIIVTYNRAYDTFACLSALNAEVTAEIEIILFDNNSSDQTAALLAATSGIRIIKSSENLHFLRAANQAAESATGELLLFLNNDTAILPGALQAVIESFRNHQQMGVLGARLIHLDGTLQEVGGSIMPDGSTIGNGVGEHPLAVPFLLQRSVDYCSGAFLATPRQLWKRIGGFDPNFSPAYYEDVDYCVRVKQLGYEVLVEPRITVLHAEGAVTHNSASAKALMQMNREKLLKKHSDTLGQIPSGSPVQRPLEPPRQADPKNILMIDDFFPYATNGQGAPRSQRIVDYLLSQECRITFVALNEPVSSPESPLPGSPSLICRALRRGSSLLEFLSLNGASFGTIIISRPHNMEDFQAVRSQYPVCALNARIAYDAEAIFALREIRKQQLIQASVYSAAQVERIVSQEILRVKNAHQIWAVSSAESEEFIKRGLENVKIVNYSIDSSGDAVDFANRSGVLFVGPIVSLDTPNGEGFSWYKREVLPLLKEQPESRSLKTTHVGVDRFPDTNPDLLLNSCGQVANLKPYYDSARIFIAPVRFGSGIPVKVIEAAAHGVPVVTTSYVAQQLGWQHEVELLVADDAESFAREIRRLAHDDALWASLSEKLLARVKKDFHSAQFHAAIAESLNLSRTEKP